VIRPPYLQQGDTIGITAPAGGLSIPEITSAVDLFRQWGFHVVYGRHLFNRRGSFAGTDKQRASDVQKMLDDPKIKTIVCARGGYGSIRMVGKLNFEKFIKAPKWLVGYSDITVLHATLQQCLGIESIHGAMPRVVPPKQPDMVSFDSLRAMLFGEVSEYNLQPHRLNRTGHGTGILVGGNLSVLYSIAGTKYDPELQGKILFIEDLNEYLYHIDRMMMNLKVRGKLSALKGIVVGHMTDMKGSASGFHKPAYKIIEEAVAEYHYPVLYNFPAGHDHPNLSLPLGREVTLSVSDHACKLSF
jgi:muramoyltetrapeptide carboxypeptidase